MSRLSILLMWLLVTLVACGNPTPAPTQSAAPTTPPIAAPSPTAAEPAPGGLMMPTDLNIIKTGVQKIVDQFLDAMNKGDEQALAKVVDQENLSFKRAMSDWLKSPVYGWKGRNPKGSVTQVKIAKEPYVKVWLNGTPRGDHVWLFKWTEQSWILSEPDEEELGAKKNLETDQFTLRYFEWDDALADDVAKNIKIAYDTVSKYTGRTTKQKFLVRMSPTFQTITGRFGIGTGATYNSSFKMTSIPSPESLLGTFTGTRVSDLSETLQHEFTHMLVDDTLSPRGTLWWVNEAFAHYFSKDLRPTTVQTSLGIKVFTLKELQQLENQDVTDRQTDLYMRAQGTVAVQYMVEQLGSREKAWEWLLYEAEVRDFNQSFQKVFGVNYDQFEKGWQQFMLQKYK